MLEVKRWDFWVALATGILILLFKTGGYWSATWLSKWALIALLGGAGLSVWVARRTSFLHLPLLLYAFFELTMLAMWPQPPYHSGLDRITEMALQKNAFYGLIEFAACTAFVGYLTRSKTAQAQGICASLCVIWLVGVVGTLLLPSSGPFAPPNNGLWFGNPSMEGSLFACLLPWVYELLSLYTRTYRRLLGWICVLWLLTFAAIVRTNASVPWGVLGVVSAAYILRGVLPASKKQVLVGLGFIGVLATAMILYGQRHIGYEFWNQNGRFEIWQMAWEYFRLHGSAALGFGYSTSQIFLPLEQISTGHMHGQTFLWLHNDWLQLATEGGYVGMFCILLSAGRLLKVAWGTNAAFASFSGFVVLGAMNYPLRMPIHCFVLASVCALAERHEWKVRSYGMSAPMRDRGDRKKS